MKKYISIGVILLLMLVSCQNRKVAAISIPILSYEVNPQKEKIAFYLKDRSGNNYNRFTKLKAALAQEGKELVFAMNGGMYQKDFSPVGLYIEQGIVLSPMDDAKNRAGNFYLQPNGVFYLTKSNEGKICPSANFKLGNHINYATQSGPMLVIDGKIHAKFNATSSNINIRNGVGILPNGNLLFALSKEKINFYSFALFFKEKGCRNALYLDGFVSKAYLPSQDWVKEDGNFGVIIGQTQ
ncbi:phosphodiester glycosidase family protein [Aureispira anguillae]|uniref:Phosphodiester glycosidase family protein n=1 Tax=Aureispira anguillae TaxID=2864201 RepID=A0A915YEA1_9BACT|nr:phosphodiester glycosidase family protein [Aureispira anguillae]BDS11416.1 phosphodiester glycosidase family protein [Aureispira anguillae]